MIRRVGQDNSDRIGLALERNIGENIQHVRSGFHVEFPRVDGIGSGRRRRIKIYAERLVRRVGRNLRVESRIEEWAVVARAIENFINGCVSIDKASADFVILTTGHTRCRSCQNVFHIIGDIVDRFFKN